MLQVEDIHTYYGDSHILQGVSLNVNDGELVCLVGRNGAGKTTTIRSIIGFNRPRAGHIVFNGTDTTGLPPYKIAGLGIGLVPQGRRIFPDLSVQENLLFAHKRGGPWDLNKVYQVFPRLKERQKNRGDQLSGGEQQMLAIARALLMNPALMLMDGRIIKEVKGEGLSVLPVEQNLALGLSVADRCYVLNKGHIVYESSPEELRQNEQVKHQYLGV
jgi:branched-chain amino acid transport system ATP-binding protein